MINVHLGDNMDILPTLKSGSYDLIYIDPPFNTGKKQNRKLKSYSNGQWVKSKTGYADSYNNFSFNNFSFNNFSFNNNYMEFIEPRLRESYRLLSPRGSLFFHIDYREVHYCKVLLDKIFGRNCFINEIIWAYDFGGRSKNKWPAKHDNILWYAKSNCILDRHDNEEHPPGGHGIDNNIPSSGGHGIDNNIPSSGGHGLDNNIPSSGDHDEAHPPGGHGIDNSIPSSGGHDEAHPPGGYIFRYDQMERIPYMAPGLCGAVKAAMGKTPTDVWWQTIVCGKEKCGYATQKPLALLCRIMRAHTYPGCNVLDFFAGSGTTGIAAIRYGCHATLIDSNPDAVEIMKKRIKLEQSIQ